MVQTQGQVRERDLDLFFDDVDSLDTQESTPNVDNVDSGIPATTEEWTEPVEPAVDATQDTQTIEEAVEWDIATEWEDIASQWTVDELLKDLETISTDIEERTESVDEATEDLQEAMDTWADIEHLRAQMSTLTEQLAERDQSIQKLQKTLDVIQREHESVLDENLQFKYWTGSDSRVLDLINSNENVQSLVGSMIAEQRWDSGASERVIESLKEMYKQLTWVNLDEMQQAERDRQTDAFAGEQDMAINLPDVSQDTDDIFI